MKFILTILLCVAWASIGNTMGKASGGDVVLCMSSPEDIKTVVDRVIYNMNNMSDAEDPFRGGYADRIQSVELLDLYDLKQFGDSVMSTELDYHAIIDNRINLLEFKYGNYTNLIKVRSEIEFTPSNFRVMRLNKIRYQGHLEENCEVIQLAVMRKDAIFHKVLYETRLFNKLSELDKAAFSFHSWFLYMHLSEDYKSSEESIASEPAERKFETSSVRDFTGQIFSEGVENFSANYLVNFSRDLKLDIPNNNIVIKNAFGHEYLFNHEVNGRKYAILNNDNIQLRTLYGEALASEIYMNIGDKISRFTLIDSIYVKGAEVKSLLYSKFRESEFYRLVPENTFKVGPFSIFGRNDFIDNSNYTFINEYVDDDGTARSVSTNAPLKFTGKDLSFTTETGDKNLELEGDTIRVYGKGDLIPWRWRSRDHKVQLKFKRESKEFTFTSLNTAINVIDGDYIVSGLYIFSMSPDEDNVCKLLVSKRYELNYTTGDIKCLD